MEWRLTKKFCDQDILWSTKFVGLTIKKLVLTTKWEFWPWNWNWFWPWKLLTILSALECHTFPGLPRFLFFGLRSVGLRIILNANQRGLGTRLGETACCTIWDSDFLLKNMCCYGRRKWKPSSRQKSKPGLLASATSALSLSYNKWTTTSHHIILESKIHNSFVSSLAY